MSTPTRVLVLAGDALDDLLVRQWTAEGLLPTFQRFMREGTWIPTRNPPGLYVGALWPSFATGASPARHGRYCHHQIRPGSYDTRLFLAKDLQLPPFWVALSRAGRRVALIDVPKMPITPDLQGMQLVDWGTHDPDPGSVFAAWPPDLAADVRGRFGSDPVGMCDRVPRTPDALRALRDNLIRRIETKGRLARHYLTQGGWDLFLTVFNDPQCAGHQLWHLHDPQHPKYDGKMAEALGDPVRDVYVAIDAAMGTIFDSVGPETAVLIYGSHGMGPNYGGSFLLDEVLRRIEAARLPFAGLRRRAGAAARWVWEHTPLRLGQLPGPVAHRLRDQLGAALPTLDVSGTRRCFQVPNNDAWGAIRVNLVGREPQGRVRTGEEYDRFCAQLARDLQDLVDVDSERPFVRRVLRTDTLYARRPDDDLPDLLIEWQHDRPIVAVTSRLIGTVRGRYSGVRTGDHRPDGFVVAIGPDGVAGTVDRHIAVEDLAPSIAAHLDVTLEGVDGTPVPELLDVFRPAGREPKRA